MARRDTNDRDQGHFHPSTVGHCARQVVLERLQVPKAVPHDVRIERIFENGHATHERITGELRDAGILVAEEVALTAPEHNLAGHCDGIGRIPLEGHGSVLVVLEIKTAKDSSYHWVTGGGMRKYQEHGPSEAYRSQVQLYMWMTGLHYALFIFENKDTQERAYFIEKRDPELINQLLEKVDMINEYVESKALPLRDAEHQPVRGKPVFDCTYCDYKELCEAEERGEVQDLFTWYSDQAAYNSI